MNLIAVKLFSYCFFGFAYDYGRPNLRLAGSEAL